MHVIPHENITLEGAFGDRKVLVVRCCPPKNNGISVVLLHGVHSSASLRPTNKFSHLAEVLTEKGYTPWIVETSRKTRDRYKYPEYIDWAEAAFGGKTYEQEQRDCFTAIEAASQRGGILWLWGFSLGGLIALSAASMRKDEDILIVSGTGLRPYNKTYEYMMELPILSTMRESIAFDMLSRVSAERFISFRGTNDEIFPEESCLEIMKEIPLPKDRKYYYPVEGADHSFVKKDGKNAPELMEEMVEKIELSL